MNEEGWVLFEAYGNKIPLIDEEEKDVVEQLVSVFDRGGSYEDTIY